MSCSLFADDPVHGNRCVCSSAGSGSSDQHKPVPLGVPHLLRLHALHHPRGHEGGALDRYSAGMRALHHPMGHEGGALDRYPAGMRALHHPRGHEGCALDRYPAGMRAQYHPNGHEGGALDRYQVFLYTTLHLGQAIVYCRLSTL